MTNTELCHKISVSPWHFFFSQMPHFGETERMKSIFVWKRKKLVVRHLLTIRELVSFLLPIFEEVSETSVGKLFEHKNKSSKCFFPFVVRRKIFLARKTRGINLFDATLMWVFTCCVSHDNKKKCFVVFFEKKLSK